MAGAGVQRHEPPAAELERHLVDREAADVEPERVLALAEQGGELVEQPGPGADPVVLHPGAELRELAPVGLVEPAVGQQRQRQRDLDGRARRQPRAAGQVAADGQLDGP